MKLVTSFRTRARTSLSSALLAMIASAATPARSAESYWWKGNLHTHSLWSDGDDYPEMIADWYKQRGYQFLALSDHNRMQEGQRWLELKPAVSIAGEVRERGGGSVLKKYLERFGADWVEQREVDGTTQVRLKPLNEYRALLEESGHFLLLPSMEVTHNRVRSAAGAVTGATVHINVTNLRDAIKPVESDDALEIMQRTVDAVIAQRENTGQPMFPHINHPNFQWGITPEELMQVRGERFFEVYNGHSQVNNDGDASHASMDRMWDIILTRRLTALGLPVMYGIASDDSHNYHTFGVGRTNPGRGWVMVRAKRLTPESIIHAMEAGDFYATSGVLLQDVRREKNQISITIAGEPGVTYVTQFIGTRKGYDPRNESIPLPADTAPGSHPHRRYSAELGATLSEGKGINPSYTLKGDEIYVRAKIVSSKSKENGSVTGEFETAWIQPMVNPL